MSWRFQLLNKPWGGVTEGPIWDGEAVYFTHIPTSRIMRLDPKNEQISQWRGDTNCTNGLCYDSEGRLFGCSSGGRASGSMPKGLWTQSPTTWTVKG